MQFETVAEFFAMGGHGLYVWLAYGATLVLLLLNFLSARLAHRRTLDNLHWQAAAADELADETHKET